MTAISFNLDALDFTKSNGVVTVVTQDTVSGVVLMVAHSNREALERTLATGEMHYTSRTRGLWHKGATSGNIQRVVSLTADCDGDAVLARVMPAGPACHTGQVSCFGDEAMGADMLGTLDKTIASRVRAMPESEEGRTSQSPGAARSHKGSYTQQLFANRNLRLKKLGEEAVELATACADNDATQASEEAADLFYHILVALHGVGASLSDVRRVLNTRSTPHQKTL